MMTLETANTALCAGIRDNENPEVPARMPTLEAWVVNERVDELSDLVASAYEVIDKEYHACAGASHLFN
jgi:hypothetical protein